VSGMAAAVRSEALGGRPRTATLHTLQPEFSTRALSWVTQVAARRSALRCSWLNSSRRENRS
jgi:hypothetical protein